LAIFNTIFCKIGGGLLFWGTLYITQLVNKSGMGTADVRSYTVIILGMVPGGIHPQKFGIPGNIDIGLLVL